MKKLLFVISVIIVTLCNSCSKSKMIIDELSVSLSENDAQSGEIYIINYSSTVSHKILTFYIESGEYSSVLDVKQIIISLNADTSFVKDVVNNLFLRVVSTGDFFKDWVYISDRNLTNDVVSFSTAPERKLFPGYGLFPRLECGERIEVELFVEMKRLEVIKFRKGETIQASILASNLKNWVVEANDGLAEPQLNGSAIGKQYTLSSLN